MKKKNNIDIDISNQLFDRLEYYLNKKNISVYRLHQLTGISLSTLYGIFSGRKNLPSLSNLLIILDALDVEPWTFFAPDTVSEYGQVAEGNEKIQRYH